MGTSDGIERVPVWKTDREMHNCRVCAYCSVHVSALLLSEKMERGWESVLLQTAKDSCVATCLRSLRARYARHFGFRRGGQHGPRNIASENRHARHTLHVGSLFCLRQHV